MQTGWLKNKNNWYYLNEKGDMQIGWLKYKNKWYYLQKSGAMISNKCTKIDNSEFCFDIKE